MIGYFDCFSGISGDMVLGALVDAGVSPRKLQRALSGLAVGGFRLKVSRARKAGLLATKVDVITQEQKKTGGRQQKGRTWRDIEKIIKTSSLPEDIQTKGLLIFRRLFDAEAKVHGEPHDKIHLHELGAVDCLVDVFGSLIGLDMLGLRTICSSAINLGSGTVRAAHGMLPVPSPAVAELLRGVPVYSSDMGVELTTPTGAAVISTLSEGFGVMPGMRVNGIGTGAGSRDMDSWPNVLRLFVGQREELRPQGPSPVHLSSRGKGGDDEVVTVTETNVDDMNPQVYEYVMERLFRAGALDVFLTQVIMKKGRPGVKITVLCSNSKTEEMMRIIFRETTSIGLRSYEVSRQVLDREIKSVQTRFGKVRVKVSKSGQDIEKTVPEFEDCRRIAKKFNIPLPEVIKEVSLSGKPRGRAAKSRKRDR